MMRGTVEAANFKKFFGSDFLSDFTLVIQSEHQQAELDSSSNNSSSCIQDAGQGLQQHPQHDEQSSLPAAVHPCSGQLGACEAGSATAAAAAAVQQVTTASPLVKRNSANSLATQLPAAAPRTSSSSNASSSTDSDGSSIVTMPVHGVVLAAASPYFETLLRDWKSSSNTLHMVVAEEQMQAAQVLLSFLYSSTVPSNLSQHDLLQLLLLADRFDVRRAAAAASRVLGCLSPAALEWSTLTGIWALPDHLFEADEQAPVRVVAWDRLMQLFGDLEDTWATADGRSLWQQLPPRAVTALAASDALAVANENTVFAALSSWIAHAVSVYGRQLSPYDLRLLAASVRLPAVGPCYLSYVALQHEWFRQAIDVAALARSAAFAAASGEVRKDLVAHTAATTNAALVAAEAATGSSKGGGGGCDSSGSAAARALGSCCMCSAFGDTSGSSVPCSPGQRGSSSSSNSGGSSSSRGRCSHCQLSSYSGVQQAQLLALAQAVQRPRASSCKRACFFQWHVDLAAIKQLHEEVAAAGSRDSRILRSPAHSFAGYEWALQLEITQTRGATGFDGSKPWALGVFLTCQVRVEVPNRQADQPAAAAAAGEAGTATVGAGGATAAATTGSSTTAAAGGGEAAAGELQGAGSGPGSSSGGSGSPASAKGPLLPSVQPAPNSGGGSSSQQQQQQQAPLLMQLVDFGFVSTAATISVREVGGKDKRCEKSWEHAVVRYRASWGWPNYLDVAATGWDEAAFERWVIDGQMHLQASVRVLG